MCLDYRIKNTNENEMNGKGDKRRPMRIPILDYELRWDRIFKKKVKKK